MKFEIAMLSLTALLLVGTVTAQPQLPNPGITPDSPFYFLDSISDAFQSSENVADEKLAEVVAMANQSKQRAIDRAMKRYERAMRKRQEQANKTEERAEEVTRQASNHLAVLAKVREKVPQEARKGIDTAINNSARQRGKALGKLREKNRERARSVANSTLQEVLANAPQPAKRGLRNALENVRKERGPEGKGAAGGQQGNASKGGPQKNVSKGGPQGGEKQPAGNDTDTGIPDNPVQGQTP